MFNRKLPFLLFACLVFFAFAPESTAQVPNQVDSAEQGQERPDAGPDGANNTIDTSFHVSVRPHPDSEGLSLQLREGAASGVLELRLYDKLGRLLRESRHKMQPKHTIVVPHTEALDPGEYTLKMDYQSKQRSLPFVKQ